MVFEPASCGAYRGRLLQKFSLRASPALQALPWLHLIALIAASSCLIVSAAPIYLSPDPARPAWGGDCGNSTCKPSSPCYLPSSQTLSGSGPCVVIFLNGTYNNTSLLTLTVPTTSPKQLDIIFSHGLITSLKLDIVSPSLTQINGTGSLLYKSELRLSVSGGAHASIDHLRLYGSTIYFGPLSSLNITSGSFRNSMLHYSSATLITHVHLEALDCDSFISPSVAHFDSYYEGDYTPATVPPGEDGSFPPRSASSSTKRDSHLATDSHLQASTRFSDAASPPETATSSTKRSVSDTSGFLATNFYSGTRSTWNRTSIELTSLFHHFENCSFVDTSVSAYAGSKFIRTTFVQYLPNNQVSVSLPLTMQDFAFSNPNRHPSSYMRISGNTLMITPSSNVSISDLVLDGGALVNLGDIEITQSIRSSSAGNPATIQPVYPNVTWNLYSIDILNVYANFTGLEHLIYTPSNASKGISFISAKEPLSPLPQRISINWHSGLPPPTYLEVYPVTNFSRNGSSHLIPLSAPFSPYPIAASFGIPNSTLMTFQSFYNPQFPSTCSNPPPGFICSPTGTLYAPTSINQPSVTIPDQSGNVVIIGNLTVHSGIILTGAGSALAVLGCTNIGNGITLDMDSEKALPKGPVTLITQSENCGGQALNKIPLKVKSSKEGCKRVSVKTDPSSPPSQLIALFVVDSSRCNVKWIIIGAVLGAVLIIAVIVAFVLGSYLHARSQRRRAKMT